MKKIRKVLAMLGGLCIGIFGLTGLTIVLKHLTSKGDYILFAWMIGSGLLMFIFVVTFALLDSSIEKKIKDSNN